MYTPAEVSLAKQELARLEALESAGPAAHGGRNPFEGLSTKRIYALTDKSRAFDCFPIHPTVMALNDYFLQPNYLLNSFLTVVIQPGEKGQMIHTDDGLIQLPRPRPLMGTVCIPLFPSRKASYLILSYPILSNFIISVFLYHNTRN